MSKPISRLWFLGPPAAILLSVLVYYAKFASVRHWVDAKFPWIEDHIGSHLPSLDEAPRVSSPPRRTASTTPVSTEAAPLRPPPITPPPKPTYLTADGSVDLKKLAADRSAWPSAVTLKSATGFPAVVGGKVVGNVAAPAGAEARLVSIQDGKLGVEYQGGGAWLTVEQTDLPQRLKRAP